MENREKPIRKKKNKKEPAQEPEQEIIAEEPEIKTEEAAAKPKKSKAKWIILAVIFVLLLGLSSCYQYLSGNLREIINTNEQTSLYKQLQLLLSGHNEPLLGEDEDRINILLLGIGGEGHDGGNLTDTIMVMSVKPSTKQIALLSLPRDLAVKNSEKQYMKINRAYADGGMNLIKEKIKEVTGQAIHYYVVLDFEGFQKIIDDLGGIEVAVENNFDGYYHISDCGGTCDNADGGPIYLDKKKTEGPYCVFTFTQGTAEMNGETALMYARIRHAKVAKGTPSESSDFARAKRQQKVLEALQKKAFATSTLVNPIKIANILDDLSENLETNLELWQMGKLVMLTDNLKTSGMIHEVVDNGKNGLVKDEIDSISGAYFAVPKAGWGKYEEIQKKADNIFAVAAEPDTNINTNANININAEPPMKKESAKIIILNGTATTGLAKQTSDKLTALGLNVVSIGNNPTQNIIYTAVFDLTNSNPETLDILKKQLGAEKSDSDFNKLYINNNININTADFIVVLGQDYE